MFQTNVGAQTDSSSVAYLRYVPASPGLVSQRLALSETREFAGRIPGGISKLVVASIEVGIWPAHGDNLGKANFRNWHVDSTNLL